LINSVTGNMMQAIVISIRGEALRNRKTIIPINA